MKRGRRLRRELSNRALGLGRIPARYFTLARTMTSFSGLTAWLHSSGLTLPASRICQQNRVAADSLPAWLLRNLLCVEGGGERGEERGQRVPTNHKEFHQDCKPPR